jgi:hypothetical protein
MKEIRMHTGAEAAVEFLESAFRGSSEFQPISKLQDGWRGAPEFLAQAAVRLGALIGATGDGERTLFVDTAGIDAARARHVAKPTPDAAMPTSPTLLVQPKASAPAVGATKELSMTYTNSEIRSRVNAIFGSSASRGREGMALMLVSSNDVSIDAALQALRIAGGHPPDGHRLNPAAIFEARAQACRQGVGAAGDSDRRSSAKPNTADGAASIYARRAAESGHTVSDVA